MDSLAPIDQTQSGSRDDDHSAGDSINEVYSRANFGPMPTTFVFELLQESRWGRRSFLLSCR
jgi:hypothetical protein